MSSISFSIIICNYNYGQYIEEAIESCLNQDYPKELCEIIVVDDGSTDSSREVLQKYKNNSQIKIIEQKNEGQASAFYSGAYVVQNDFICLLDSDDWFHKDKLKTVANKINELQEVTNQIFLCHDTEIYDEIKKKNKELSGFEILNLPVSLIESMSIEETAHHFPFSTPSGQVFSKDLFQTIIEGIPLSEWKICADEPIAHAAMLSCGRVFYLNEKLSTYRIHDTNFALLVNESGQIAQKGDWVKHRPKLLSYLERFIDGLPINQREREERLNYLSQQQKITKRISERKKYSVPKVSFIVTNHNYSEYLERCINSILRQTHTNLEIIIVDDLSIDSSNEVINYLCKKHPQIKSIQNETNLGQLGSMRAGYLEAKGHYVVFVDADDTLDEYFTERHIYAHRFISLCMVTSNDISFIDKEDNLIHANFYSSCGYWKEDVEYFAPLASSLIDWVFSPCSANMIRKTKQLDLFFRALDEQTIRAFRLPGDWLILHYAHALGGNLRFNESLTNFRLHEKNNCTQLHFPSELMRDLRSNPPDIKAGIEFLFKLLCTHFQEFKLHYLPIGLNRYLQWIFNPLEMSEVKILYNLAISLNSPDELLAMVKNYYENKMNIKKEAAQMNLNSRFLRG
jgi:glycosyltransferase involved in cell wall biosynthesis